MPVPNKIKMFAWRACKDCLPTKVNLIKRNVTLESSCGFCQHPEEDLSHAMFYCPQIRDMWSQLLPSLTSHSSTPIPELISELEKDMNKVATFFSLAWGFWHWRNKWEFDNVQLNSRQVSNHALGLMKYHTSFPSTPHIQNKDNLSWKPPPSGTFKLNTDGAIFPDSQKAGVGSILRDYSGKMVMATSKVETDVEDPEKVELMAVFRGLQLCATMGISHIQVKSDRLLLIQALQQNNMIHSMLGNLYSEVQHLT